ncbi:MAG: ParB/RepB/Spo0J family partition protein [Acidobacteriota bacterium]|nr:ParB/RepB/Spo0J family partition protein [Acidobacteriota bacterium]MDH3527924.1 ParB/RepB/Spo0J family partition protein [Acidobacteriota bacterium]
MARQALGRGLSALLGEDTAGANKEKDFLEIGIEMVEPNSEQPRDSFPETELDELTQSIQVNGVVQPILVRARGTKYQIVAGERRWRAAQKAGLKHIPAVVREIDDDKMLEIALIENIQRQQLNPVEEAKAYQKLIDDLGLTQQAVAERVGKTRTFIANYLRLLNLPEPVLVHLGEGRISVGHAKALLSIESTTRQKELANAILLHGLSVRDAEKAAKRKPRKASPKPAPADPNLKKAETRLRRKLGTQVKIIPARQGQSGKIEIEYYGTEDLDRLYNLLLGK